MAYTANLIPAMTTATAPSGIVTASSYYGVCYPFLAFDQVANTDPWYSNAQTPAWLGYEFTEAKTITQYTMTSRYSGDYSPTPKDWTFEGYNGSTWDVLDTQSGRTYDGYWGGVNVKKTFPIANSTAYTKYRVNVSAPGLGNTYIVIGAIEMMETVVVPGDLPASSGSISIAGSADLTGFFAVVDIAAGGTIDVDGSASLTAVGLTYLAAAGTVAIDGYADLTPWDPMVAVGTIALGGEAWLTTVLHGEDTLQAVGTIELRGTAVRLSTGETLPPTDDLGWTAPDVTIPDLRGLVVKVGGLAIKRAQITDLVIELDTEGGPKSATLSVNCALTRAPKLMQTLEVTYKGQTLFPKKGRLEHIGSNVDSSTGYTLTYAGPLVTLRDHKAFRTVYVESDLQSWQTDQGPRTSPDTFEVASRSSGATV